MAYITPEQVFLEIPQRTVRDALDDEGDGKDHLEVLAGIIDLACGEVDGYLGGLFTVPFAEPVPAKVRSAAMALTIQRIYWRRQDDLPKGWADKIKFWTEHLQKVGNGDLPFDASVAMAFTPGAAVTEELSVDAQST